jgi:hypothetical protein
MKASGDTGGADNSRPSGGRSHEEDSVTTISTSVNIGKKPAPVTLSDAATTKVAELLAQEEGDNLALRVAVKPGGCSGYSYEMFATRTCGCGSSFS